MTHPNTTACDTDRAHDTNPVAAIAIHGALTALLLGGALQVGLPLAAAAALAWAGGAGATVALLLAHDAVTRGDPAAGDLPAPATVPDL